MTAEEGGYAEPSTRLPRETVHFILRICEFARRNLYESAKGVLTHTLFINSIPAAIIVNVFFFPDSPSTTLNC
jgi:hypothetical protein